MGRLARTDLESSHTQTDFSDVATILLFINDIISFGESTHAISGSSKHLANSSASYALWINYPDPCPYRYAKQSIPCQSSDLGEYCQSFESYISSLSSRPSPSPLSSSHSMSFDAASARRCTWFRQYMSQSKSTRRQTSARPLNPSTYPFSFSARLTNSHPSF
jgi:hypothetical protein